MFSYLFVTCLVISGAVASSLSSRAAPDRSCPSLCRCGRRGEVTCAEEDCLQNIPTANLTTQEGATVRSLFVAKQKDLLIIRDNDLTNLPNLKKVRIINNRLLGAIQHGAFKYNQHVTQLDLHHNSFKSFPSEIKNLRKLSALNLGGNQISYIPTDAFQNNPNLQRLILRRNKIQHFPRNLPVALVKLTIGNNLIINVEDLTYLKNLLVLRINSNKLTRIHADILPTSLRELSICQNLLTSQSSLSVANLENLRKLRLAGNPRIGRITRNTFFKSTNQLQQLDLRFSGINVIDRDAFANLHDLRAIDLSGNRVREFKSDWLKYSRNFKSVKLANNSWHCTCDMNSDLRRFNKEVARLASTNQRSEIDVLKDFGAIECSSLDYHLRSSNMEVLRNDSSHKMAAYDFSTCPVDSEPWTFVRARSPPGGTRYDTSATTSPRTKTSGTGNANIHKVLKPATTKSSPNMSTKTKFTITQITKPTTTATIRKTTTIEATSPTTSTATTTKTTTTEAPTPTTTTATTRKTTTTEASTPTIPTATIRKTTTIKATSPTTSTATTTKTTTTEAPTPTTTTATTRKTTTTTEAPTPTTSTATTRKTTTIKPTATEVAKKNIERVCTKSGDCEFPFMDDNNVEYYECAPGTWGPWCQTADSWDYCKPCP